MNAKAGFHVYLFLPPEFMPLKKIWLKYSTWKNRFWLSGMSQKCFSCFHDPPFLKTDQKPIRRRSQESFPIGWNIESLNRQYTQKTSYFQASPVLYLFGGIYFLHQRYTYQLVYPLRDNARPHGARTSLEWFRSQDITLQEWPVFSPDLNPIENVWALMKWKISGRYKKLYIVSLVFVFSKSSPVYFHDFTQVVITHFLASNYFK